MADLKGKITVIVGEVSSGKTGMTRRLLNDALENGPGPITVIDMAPSASVVEGIRVGGYLVDEDIGARILRDPDIKTPRLSGGSAMEIVEMALCNRLKIEKLLREFKNSPSPSLFINDVSIFLQLGNLSTLWEALKVAETVVINGYLGEKLEEDKGSGISEHEKQMMAELISRAHVVIRV